MAVEPAQKDARAVAMAACFSDDARLWRSVAERLVAAPFGLTALRETQVVFTVRVSVNGEQPDESSRWALDAVVDALGEQDGLRTGSPYADGPDLVVEIDGRVLTVEVKTGRTVRPGDVAALPAGPGDTDVRLLVADRIPTAAREALAEQGWSWLDLRGHLRLRAPGVLVDRQVRPRQPVPRRAAGRAWREVAFALLAPEHGAAGVRPLARFLSLSPASVSQQLSAMHEANLLDRDGQALVPELFWELAGRWRSEPVPLLREPQPGDPQSLGLGLGGSYVADGIEVATPGWALTGTLAAIVWGAPVAASQAWPPDFLLPSPEQVSRASRVLGAAPDMASRGCTVAVAPIRQAVVRRFDPPDAQPAPGTHWRLAHPVAVALDLAQDKARGSEILADWKPPGRFRRVW